MKVAVVGATGVIGRAIVEALAGHEVICAARSGGDVTVDATDTMSISAFFAALGSFDALVSAIGMAGMGPLERLGSRAFEAGWQTKVRAQIDLVRLGLTAIADGGSFVLSSGFLSKAPMPGFAAVATANAAIEGFCRSAALEMPRGVRINSVSPVFVLESMRAAGIDDLSGYTTQTAAETAAAYVRAITGTMNGTDIDPRAAWQSD